MTAVLDVPLAAASWTAIGTGIRLVVTDPPALDRGQALLKVYLAALDANIASTAAIIRGLTAPAWLSGLGLAARLVTASGAVTTTGGWPAEDPS